MGGLEQKTVNNIFDFNERFAISYFFISPLFDEIYHALKLYVKFVKCRPIEEIERELSKLNAFLDADKKISFLKQLHEKIYIDFCVDLEYFYDTGVSFKDYVCSIIEDNPVFIKLYLKQSKKTLKTTNTANDYHINNLEVCLCTEKIIESNKKLINEEFFSVIEEWAKGLQIELYLTEILDLIKKLEEEIKTPKTKTATTNLTFKKSFKVHEDYDLIMKKLKSNEIISEDNSIVSQGHGYKDLRIVSCIGYLLQKHHFINKMFDKDFVNILSSTFKIELKAGTYSKAKKHFDECLKDPHLDLLHFIK